MSSPEGCGLLQVAGVLLSGPRRLPLIDIPTAPGLESRTALRDPPRVRARPFCFSFFLSSSSSSSSPSSSFSSSSPSFSSLFALVLLLFRNAPSSFLADFPLECTLGPTAGYVDAARSLLFLCVAWVCVPSLCPVIVCKSYSRSLPSWSRDRLDEAGPSAL